MTTGIPSDQLGSVGQLPDGRFFVLFERQTRHPIDKVWQAITDPTRLQAWFPELRLQAEPGGQFSIWFGDGCDGPADVSGTVTEFDPPHVLQYGDMRFELVSTPTGCLIKFSDILHFDRGRTPGEVTDSVLAGWHKFMDGLQAYLNGSPIDRSRPEPDYRNLRPSGRELVK